MEVRAAVRMPELRVAQRARSPLHNRLSYAGLLLVLLSIIHLIALLIVEFDTGRSSPYVGSLSYLLLPAALLPGLLLVLIGAALENRRQRAAIARAGGQALPRRPSLGLSPLRHWRLLVLVATAGGAVLVTLATAGYRGYEFVESTRFCAGVCHQQMRPEAVAHEESAHSAIACSACHVGPGAAYFIRSKWSGLNELTTLLRNSYPRPIPSSPENLPPARTTCEECHAPEKNYGNQILTRPHFVSDERNSDRSVAVAVKTGGGSSRTGLSSGVHWHADAKNRVSYAVSEEDHQTIAWVSVTDRNGKTTEYFSTERPISAEALARAEKREMDCLDCHNRQGHSFLTPDEAIDQAIANGEIDRRLPYVRRVALDLISREYHTEREARQRIADGIVDFYRGRYPRLLADQAGAIRRSAEGAQEVWARNVFPEMNITWGTYPDNIGHRNAPGCFRCHDERHASKNGKTISQDCSTCHVPPVPAPSTTADLAGGSITATAGRSH